MERWLEFAETWGVWREAGASGVVGEQGGGGWVIVRGVGWGRWGIWRILLGASRLGCVR